MVGIRARNVRSLLANHNWKLIPLGVLVCILCWRVSHYNCHFSLVDWSAHLPILVLKIYLAVHIMASMDLVAAHALEPQ
jgi:hypothetical protein